MAPRTNRPQAGLLVCLADPLPDPNIPVARCADPSCEVRDPSESSTLQESDTNYSGRLPRFAYIVTRRRASSGRTDSSHETATPTKPPVIDRSIEEE